MAALSQQAAIEDLMASGLIAEGRVEQIFQAMIPWCPVCHRYHDNPGEKTDAGRLTRPCPRIARDAPWNMVR